MNRFIKILCIAITLVLPAVSVSATSLDELYRDIVKSDNEGYLPMFVKNRNAPDALFDEDIPALPKAEIKEDKSLNQEISFVNRHKLKEEAARAEALKWESTVRAVKANRVTPVELDEIKRRINNDDSRAIEIYAWMNARGVGTGQDLIKAFVLYQKAAFLNVPNASKNAALVYRSMSPEQRDKLTVIK